MVMFMVTAVEGEGGGKEGESGLSSSSLITLEYLVEDTVTGHFNVTYFHG